MSTVKTGVVGAGYVGTATCPVPGEGVTAASVQNIAQAVLDDAAFLNAVVTDGTHIITCLDVQATTIHGNGGTVASVFGTGSINGKGVNGQGSGTGNGVAGTGGATGDGVSGAGGSTSGDGVYGVAGPIGDGVSGVGGSTSGAGVRGVGGASGQSGGEFTGSGTGDGATCVGGSSGGPGGRFTGGGTTGTGVFATGGSTNGTGVIGSGIGASGYGGSFSANAASLAIVCGAGNMAFTGAQPAKTADPGFNNYLAATNVCKAWGSINVPLGVPSLTDGYNTASVASSGVNAITITMARAMATTGYAPTVSIAASNVAANVVPQYTVSVSSTTVFTVTFYSNPTTLQDITTINLAIFFNVFGRQ